MYFRCIFSDTWCSTLRASNVCDEDECAWYWYVYSLIAYPLIIYLLFRILCIVSPAFKQKVWLIRMAVDALGALIKVIGWESLRIMIVTKIQSLMLRKISEYAVVDDGVNITVSYYWADTNRIYKIVFPKSETSTPITLLNITSTDCKITKLRDFMSFAGPFGNFHSTTLTPFDMGYDGRLDFTYQEGENTTQGFLTPDEMLSSIITKLLPSPKENDKID